MMSVFELTLLADSITLVTVGIAAIRRRSWSYWLLAAVAACATVLALRQVMTGQANVFAVIFTAALVAAMTARFALNLRGASPRGKQRS